jgi:alpha-tubulin suppressor-like RCC1 family protein
VLGLRNVVAVAAGYNHSLALLRDGSVQAWGGNCYGLLGDGTTTDRHAPVTILDSTGHPPHVPADTTPEPLQSLSDSHDKNRDSSSLDARAMRFLWTRFRGRP